MKLILVLALASTNICAGDFVKVLYDPKPEPGIPFEARHAGTVPVVSSGTAEVSFASVSDLKDYGPIGPIIGTNIYNIVVRYHDDSFKNVDQVSTYLNQFLQAKKGVTHTFCYWAQGLGVPSVEAVVQFRTLPQKGKLLIWRASGLFVYQDPNKKWWFGEFQGEPNIGFGGRAPKPEGK